MDRFWSQVAEPREVPRIIVAIENETGRACAGQREAPLLRSGERAPVRNSCLLRFASDDAIVV